MKLIEMRSPEKRAGGTSWRSQLSNSTTSPALAGKLTKLTRTLVRAKGSSARGASYALVDRRVGRGASQYRLQVVTLEGRRSWSASAALRARR